MAQHELSSQSANMRLEEAIGLFRRRKWTVVITALLVFVLSFIWVGTSTPVYRASATLLIDPDSGENGLLSELASIGKAPAAASEIAIIGSRSIAELVVKTPNGVDLASPVVLEFRRHLGLTTTVEDESLRPLATLWRRLFGGHASTGQLFARVAHAADDAPRIVRVYFPEPGRVRFSNPGVLANFGIDAQRKTVAYRSGADLEYRGLKIRLHAEGDVSGRNFLIHRSSRDEAARALKQNTRIIETERDSGVVMVTVNDSDPHRAARIADALCLNYFDINIDRGSKRASQTVGFIEDRLDEQRSLLATAEEEVAGLQTIHPETINVSTAATALIERLSELEVERVHMSITHATLGEALALVEADDFSALSRLGNEIADPMTRTFIEQISLLTAEYEMQDRTDTGAYKLLKQRRLEELEAEADRLAAQVASFGKIIESYEQGDSSVLAGLSGTTVDGYGAGPLVAAYLIRITDLESERTELAQTYTPEFPRSIEILATIAGLRAHVLEQLIGRYDALQQMHLDRQHLIMTTRAIIAEHPQQEREKILAALENLRLRTISHMQARFEGVEVRRSALDDQISSVEERLGKLPERERELAGPLRRLEAHAEIVKFLLKSLQDAEIARAATIATAEFIDPAQPPIRRYAPRVSFTLMLGSILGVLVGMGFAYLRESLRGSIHTEAELEAVSGLPTLGAIPDFRADKTRYAGAESFLALRDAPNGPVAEAYRSLRANLRFALEGDREIRTLAVTSCTPGEGKSVTNADLAIAFANGEKRVLLVDADLRKPRVHKAFAIERAPGLAEVMIDGMAWRECIQHSGIENLDLLSAGVHRGKPGDLLIRSDFAPFIDELIANYDIVVFDLPPALVVADVENFAHKLDAVLLLYRSDGVSKDAIRTASARLRQTGCNLVGTVLNAIRPEHGKGGGYYHSYYEYAEEEEPRFRKGA